MANCATRGKAGRDLEGEDINETRLHDWGKNQVNNQWNNGYCRTFAPSSTHQIFTTELNVTWVTKTAGPLEMRKMKCGLLCAYFHQ